MAVTAAYRLIKFGGARRLLFLVDRSNLGEQAEKEFQGFRTPDDNRKFTELYNVQRLTSNTIGASAKVVITTVQRLYSMLKGEPDLDPELEEASLFEFAGAAMKEPLPVIYAQDRFSDLRAVYRRRILASWPSYRSSSPMSRGFNGMRAIPRRTGRGTGSARQRPSRSSSTDPWSLATWRTRVPRRGTSPSDALMEDVY
jgi:hypothetical protein